MSETASAGGIPLTRLRIYVTALVLCIAGSILFVTLRFAGLVQTGKPGDIVDFDAFYIAGKLAVQGSISTAYRYADFSALQRAYSGGGDNFLPWTYPPQFDLVVAGLGPLPVWVAYLLFIAPAAAAYLLILHRLAGRWLVIVLALVYVPVLVNTSCGQNGFLTGALIGLACLGLLRRSAWAGLPLGLMIIKPHLVIALAIYVLATRQWRTVAVAAATVLATTVIATLVFGVGVWSAFAGGVAESGRFLELGVYPFFRMISPYAAIRTLGMPHLAALVLQALVAVAAIAATLLAQRRADPATALGVAVVASLLISPYAYDYDLTVLGIGLALLAPVLIAARQHRFTICSLIVAAGVIGLVQTARVSPPFGPETADRTGLVTIAGLLLIVALVLIGRVISLSRAARPDAPPPRSPAGRTAY